MNRPPLRVAVLGAGTVGGEVVRRLLADGPTLAGPDGAALVVVGIAVRDLGRAHAAGFPEQLLTDAPAHLVAAPETDVVVELIGGDEPARTLVSAALGAGKAVVTANKHVLAHHGPDLERTARDGNAAFRFEAAVAGGVPVLAPLAADLAANRLSSVRGIVNGTTNYILTAMAAEGRAYADVLAEAQRLGYAEADPRGDVEGHDAVNKVVVLVRLAFGAWLDPATVVTRLPTPGGETAAGITGVRLDDVEAAAARGLVLKLVARAERREGAIVASVLPTAVPAAAPLARTSGARNRIEVAGEPVGDVGFDGPGAGGAATSSAVLGDLLAVARGSGSTWAGLPPAAAAPVTGGAPALDGRWFVPALGPDAVTPSLSVAELCDLLAVALGPDARPSVYPVLDD